MLLLDVEFKLVLFGLCPCPEDANVRSILVPLVFDESFLEFIVEFEVAGG